MDEEKGDVSGGDAGNAGGLAEGGGADAVKALACLGLEGGDGHVVGVGRESTLLLTANAVSGVPHAFDVTGVNDFRDNLIDNFRGEAGEDVRG